jgi:hypothetical protein
MHERIPNSELVVFERSGHFARVEEPDTFFDAVRGWLRRTLRGLYWGHGTKTGILYAK